MSTRNSAPKTAGRVDRRAFMSAVVGVFASISLRSFRDGGANSETRSFAVRIVALLGLIDVPIGANRAASASDSRLTSLLRGLLGDSAESIDTLASLSDTDLRDRIRRNIIGDFEAGRINSVNGWVLSRTETHALKLRDCVRNIATA